MKATGVFSKNTGRFLNTLMQWSHTEMACRKEHPWILTVAYYEKRYDEILDNAEKAYADNPPGMYNRESYKMYNRLRKYKESELLFLYDMRVPDNNDLCERLARLYKRKQKQATVFRSDESLI